MEELINKIKEYCQEYAGEVSYYKEDFWADDYASGNIDDAWSGGMSDGQTEACNDILEIIQSFNKE